MKKLRILFLTLLCVSCSDSPMETDFGIDMSASTSDLSVDLIDSDRVDSSMSSFPDPDRESKVPCEENIDCARGTLCNSSFKTCGMTVGCAAFGGPKEDEERGCLIGSDGQSRFTEKECDMDEDCPEVYPTCIFKACQEVAGCEVDEDCKTGEVCNDGIWCKAPEL